MKETTPFLYVDPVMHAVTLIEVCKGDVDAARNIATDNAMENLCDDRQWFYWDHVRKSLMPDVRQESWN